MKYSSIIILLLFNLSSSAAWRLGQLDSANTEKNNPILTLEEKEAIKYINLCRLYPQQFISNEVAPYKLPPGFSDPELNQYKATLVATLKKRKPAKAIYFDQELYNDVLCYSNEVGNNNIPAHQRIECPPVRCAECISFGFDDGRNIALQLLIDSGVPSLGHRKICLDYSYTKVGVKVGKHFNYRFCCVLDFC